MYFKIFWENFFLDFTTFYLQLYPDNQRPVIESSLIIGHKTGRLLRLLQKPAKIAGYWGSWISRQPDIKTPGYWGSRISRQPDIEAARYWGSQILRQPDIEADGYRSSRILRQLDIKAARYWGCRISRQPDIEAANYQSCRILRLPDIEAAGYWRSKLSKLPDSEWWILMFPYPAGRLSGYNWNYASEQTVSLENKNLILNCFSMSWGQYYERIT